MDECVLKYSRQVPRYTSYPTAAQFDGRVDAPAYGRWMRTLHSDATLSLYLHVPFCRSLCWFCGCQTSVVNRAGIVAAYTGLLRTEIDMAAAALGPGRTVSHLHWGGGTPSLVSGDDFRATMGHLRRHFAFARDAEIAVEIDPREFSPQLASALAETGVTRASLGVQDFTPKVQAAVNRRQSFALTAVAVEYLRRNGITALNLDCMYGLPHQDEAGLLATIDKMLALAPSRVSLFGYAHVPWMRPHQRLIDSRALPDARARLALYRAAAARLTGAGYLAIGLDHFARPEDGLAIAQKAGRLRRDFQGYSNDRADAVIGFGASAISTLPQGYAQNAHTVPAYRQAIAGGEFATVRGVVLGERDRLRRAVIERLMCDLSVDLEAMGARFGEGPAWFEGVRPKLAPLERDGLIAFDGPRLVVAPRARPALRVVCAAFDPHLDAAETRHSAAV